MYLSRQTGPGAWQVEAWTTRRRRARPGARRCSRAAARTSGRCRRAACRATGGDMSVVWMNGGYPSYVAYDTAIHALCRRDERAADRRRRAGGAERRRAARSDLRDHGLTRPRRRRSRATPGTSATARPGRGPSRPTPTPPEGATSRRSRSPTTRAHRARSSRRSSSTCPPRPPSIPAARGVDRARSREPREPGHRLVGRVRPDRGVRRGHDAQSLPGDSGLHQVSAALPGLQAGRLYHYRVVADNATGSSIGRGPRVRGGQLARLGRLPRRRTGHRGPRQLLAARRALRRQLGRRGHRGRPARSPGATCSASQACSGPSRNTATSFDGASGELAMPGSGLGPNATLEGWFRWRAGTTVLRDSDRHGR